MRLMAARGVYYESKVLILLGHSSWAAGAGWAMPLTSLMQREQQNTIFEQWLVAYEARLVQLCAAAYKGPDKPESKKDETDLSPEVTSE
jgi:hypothetical protein